MIFWPLIAGGGVRIIMDKKTIQQILKLMEGKSTSELSQILNKNDRTQYIDEAFEAIKQILSKRKETLTKIKEFEESKNSKGLQEIIKNSDLLFVSDDERKEAIDALVTVNNKEALEEVSKDISLSQSIKDNVIESLNTLLRIVFSL